MGDYKHICILLNELVYQMFRRMGNGTKPFGQINHLNLIQLKLNLVKQVLNYSMVFTSVRPRPFKIT